MEKIIWQIFLSVFLADAACIKQSISQHTSHFLRLTTNNPQMTDLVSWYPGLDATKTFSIFKPKTALSLAEKGIICQ